MKYYIIFLYGGIVTDIMSYDDFDTRESHFLKMRDQLSEWGPAFFSGCQVDEIQKINTQ